MIKKTIFIIALVIALLGGAMASKAPAAETSEGPHLEIYGFVQLDAIYDFDRVDPSWSAALRPSKIPVNCPADPGCGKDGETIFSVRQTRFGVKAGAPTALGELNTKFEFDLFGVGADAGQTTIRLRHAYGELGQFLAGQTNSLFMDGDVFPNTIEYWGPIGMIFFRNLQLRWTPYNAQGAKVSVALEGPGSGVDAGNVNNPEGWKGWNHYPDVTAQFRADQPWGHAQVAGIVRWLGFENPTNSGITKDSGNVIGGGVNVSGSLKTVGKDKLLAQIAYGKGIASYINDCCVDVAPNDALNDGEAVPLLAWLVYYDHYWSDRWSSSVGYSMADQDNTGGQNPNAFHLGQYASGNILYYPAKNVMTGIELIWGQRENNDGAKGKDTRVQYSVKYNF